MSWPERKQIEDFKELKDDGSTACGVWIYTGVYPRADFNHARSRKPDAPDGPGTHLDWGFAWPSNRRIMYNRASADADGKPWSERKRYMWWDAEKQQWTGKDKPDFSSTKAPGYRPDFSEGPKKGVDAHDGKSPFMMSADGKAWIFVPSGLKDAPLPTHYEPVESPVRNPMYRQQDNPPVKKWPRSDNVYHDVGDPQYPYVITTYRLTEHHSGATPTRFVPSLAELQPEGFAEIPPELAAEKNIANLDWIVISTARGEIESRALVTERLRPFEIAGRRIYQIGMDREERFLVVKDDDSPVALVESEGIQGPVQMASIERLARAREQHGLSDSFSAALLINNDMAITNVGERSATTIAPEILENAVRQNVLVMRSIDLLFLLNHLEKSPNKKSRMLDLLTSGGGWLKASTGSYDVIHS